MLTVKEVKVFLKEIPDDTIVGKVGHFGEFFDMRINDFFLTEPLYEKPIYADGRKIKQWTKGKILTIMMPDIGEEPD